MTCQCQGTQGAINHTNAIRQMIVLCQECNSDHTISHEDPYHGTHNGADLIAIVEPNAILSVGSKGTFPRFIIKSIFIVNVGIVHGGFGTHDAVQTIATLATSTSFDKRFGEVLIGCYVGAIAELFMLLKRRC